MNILDPERQELTTGNEHNILECLGQSKELKQIEICGLPKGAKGLKQSKQSERKQKEKFVGESGEESELPLLNSY